MLFRSMMDREETDEMDWETFKRVFLNQYFPTPLRNKMERDLLGLKQKEYMSVEKYNAEFTWLSRYVPYLELNEDSKVNRFYHVLKRPIQSLLSAFEFRSYREIYRRALKVELDHPEFQPAKQHREKKRKGEPQSWNSYNGRSETRDFMHPICIKCGNKNLGKCLLRSKRCFYCGKTGHQAHDCQRKVMNNKVNNEPRPNPNPNPSV